MIAEMSMNVRRIQICAITDDALICKERIGANVSMDTSQAMTINTAMVKRFEIIFRLRQKLKSFQIMANAPILKVYFIRQLSINFFYFL